MANPHTQADASGRNALAAESSPYLRQHANNPVHWLPWGAAALQLARDSGRPILLSIGYSACHWCHVMAHESFEDAATAELMNALYVNIKVDREERPDLDRIYQLAHQLLHGRGGGWPLTMFLRHDDQRPFFGGTYFPPRPRHGLPAFADLLRQVANYYREHATELREPAGALVRALDDLNPPGPHAGPLGDAPMRRARAALEQSFDDHWGGFGPAPKFPHAESLNFLLHTWHASAHDATPDLQALYMATLTLTRMAEGGLFDQLGGGFCRYSVDERWEIPHFEKMLYDNALLLPVYAEAAQATGEARFREIAERTADWMLSAMRGPEGGFYSSLDADSEGHEGKYYLWDHESLRAALGAEPDCELAAAYFGLNSPPNFEGRWQLTARTSLASLAEAQAVPPDALRHRLAAIRAQLLAVRAQRVAPALDDKRLTSWNALAIRALAIAARALGRADYAQAAGDALQFLRRAHWRGQRLLAASDGSQGRLAAYLDDYALLADAILELQTVRFDADELSFAATLCEQMLQHFEDARLGGFHFTADDHEALICRSKVLGDDATPSGNAVAARVLQRLGWLLAEPRYLDAAERSLRAAYPAMEKYPQAHASLLAVLREHLQPPAIVVLRGPAAALAGWHRRLSQVYAPDRLVLAVASESQALPSALASKVAPSEGVAAYVCRGMSCSAPLTTPEALGEALASS